MKKLYLPEIAAALGVYNTSEAEIFDVSTDTREIQPGSLFVAIRGERFDGHDFISKAEELGAVAAVADHPVDCGIPVLVVGDTRKAFLDLGGWYRRRFGVRIAAVTGSVGKTSTKEMIDAVLSSQYKTLKTEGNLNNEIGLPRTLFRLDDSYEAAVIEMGMSDFGEISRLSKAANADIGVITNIGVSHIETLGSREGILKAKLEILDGLKENAPLVVNADDDLLGVLQFSDRAVLRYGIQTEGADAQAVEISKFGFNTKFEIVFRGEYYPAEVPVLGKHHVLNALAAFLVGVEFGMAPKDAARALRKYRPSGMRQNVVDHGGIIVIEDCYNASPDSMQASISVLSLLEGNGKRVAVLGDMLELGTYSEEAHRQVGRAAAASGLDALLCFGKLSGLIGEEAKNNGLSEVYYFDEKSEVARWLTFNMHQGDAVLFKASREMKFEEILSAFYGKD